MTFIDIHRPSSHPGQADVLTSEMVPTTTSQCYRQKDPSQWCAVLSYRPYLLIPRFGRRLLSGNPVSRQAPNCCEG